MYIIFILSINIESYSINKNKITVSGVSSGAAMASQMHIAYSSTITGSGIIAGRKLYQTNLKNRLARLI